MRTTTVVLAFLAVLAIFLLTFHPSRPLYMRSRTMHVASRDGTLLRATMSLPRGMRSDVPAVVVVHGSGRIGREHVIGDVRRLVRSGIAVLAYDKRGVGESAGSYPSFRGAPADSVLLVLAEDAAAAFDSLRVQDGIDSLRIGFFGASQASWIIPRAAERTVRHPRFQIILSGAAVSTGEEGFYSSLTGDGRHAQSLVARDEVERQLRNFSGDVGYNPRQVLAQTRVPTLWLLGDLDLSVPTFRSAEVLDSLRIAGNTAHTVIRYPHAGHDLRDTMTGRGDFIWPDILEWLVTIGVVAAR